MSRLMAVLLNGVAQLEYDRNKRLPDHQAAYIEKMDRTMDAGVDLGGKTIPEPDMGQRAQFVAANLAHAIKISDETAAAAMCTYLAVRLPELKQVKIRDDGQTVDIELVFDEAYVRQFPVQFHKP